MCIQKQLPLQMGISEMLSYNQCLGLSRSTSLLKIARCSFWSVNGRDGLRSKLILIYLRQCLALMSSEWIFSIHSMADAIHLDGCHPQKLRRLFIFVTHIYSDLPTNNMHRCDHHESENIEWIELSDRFMYHFVQLGSGLSVRKNQK